MFLKCFFSTSYRKSATTVAGKDGGSGDRAQSWCLPGRRRTKEVPPQAHRYIVPINTNNSRFSNSSAPAIAFHNSTPAAPPAGARRPLS